jgi:hypothetical protein
MAIYTIQGPDGKIYDIEGPDDPKINFTGAMAGGRPENFDQSLLGEVAAVADKTIRGGAFALPNLVRHAGNWLEERFGKGPELFQGQIPESLVRGYDALTTPSQPQTSAGKTLGNIGEAAVGTLVGPGMLTTPGKLLTVGAGAGAGGEAAARLTDDNALARLLGGLAGGGVAALGATYVPTATSMTKRAVKGMTEADWQTAKELEATLRAAGMPHLKSQLLGPNSSLDDIVAQASANPEVRPELLKATRVWRNLNTAPMLDERRVLQQDIQNTAKQADWGLLAKANAAYEAAMPKGGQYSAGYIENLRKDIVALANSEKFGPTSEGGKALIAFAENKLPKATPAQTIPGQPTGMLDANGNPLLSPPTVKPATGGMEKLHLNNLVKDLNVLTQQEGWKGLPLKDLKELLKSYTPEFDAARAAKRSVMETEGTPMRQGLAGTIARMGGGPNENKYTATGDIIKLVFPADKAQPMAIKQLAENIGNDQVSMLLNEHLNTAFQRAAKALGENPKAPADFVEAVLGTPAQRANIDAAIEVSAKALNVNPNAAQRGFRELVHALGTYRDLKLNTGVSQASTGFEAGKSFLGFAIAPASRAGRYLWEQASAKTYQRIADMVTSPDGLTQLERIAKTPDFRVRSAMIRGILVAADQDNPPELQ